MTNKIPVEGLSSLFSEMDSFPDKLERNILRGAMRAAARVFMLEVKARAPRLSGALAASARVTAGIKNGIIEAKVVVGGRVKGGSKKQGKDRGVFYAMWVEFGSAAHLIQAAAKSALKIGNRLVSEVSHPGAKAHPFFRPAIDAKMGEATEVVVNYIRARIDKANEDASE